MLTRRAGSCTYGGSERPHAAHPRDFTFIFVFLPIFCAHRGLPLGELPGGALPDAPIVQIPVGNMLRRVRPTAVRSLLEPLILPPSSFLHICCAHRGLLLGELPDGALPDAPVVWLPIGNVLRRVRPAAVQFLLVPIFFLSSRRPPPGLRPPLSYHFPLLFLAIIVGEGRAHTRRALLSREILGGRELSHVALLPPSTTSPREGEEPVLGSRDFGIRCRFRGGPGFVVGFFLFPSVSKREIGTDIDVERRTDRRES